MQSHQAVSEEDKKETLDKIKKETLDRIKKEREAILSRSMKKELQLFTQTTLLDSTDPLYYVDIALGIHRRELLIEALMAEFQRLETESMAEEGL